MSTSWNERHAASRIQRQRAAWVQIKRRCAGLLRDVHEILRADDGGDIAEAVIDTVPHAERLLSFSSSAAFVGVVTWYAGVRRAKFVGGYSPGDWIIAAEELEQFIRYVRTVAWREAAASCAGA